MKGWLFDGSSTGSFVYLSYYLKSFSIFQTFCDNCPNEFFPSLFVELCKLFSDEIGMKITGLWKLINALVRTSNKPDKLLLNWNEQSVEKEKVEKFK